MYLILCLASMILTFVTKEIEWMYVSALFAIADSIYDVASAVKKRMEDCEAE